jgi:hypothetical protein
MLISKCDILHNHFFLDIEKITHQALLKNAIFEQGSMEKSGTSQTRCCLCLYWWCTYCFIPNRRKQIVPGQKG